MWPICLLTLLLSLAAGRQSTPAEWMARLVSQREAGAPPEQLPARDPDAEIIGPITDPRPALDGNFQVPHGHRLAGVYRNDKPRLPHDYVRYLRRQGLTPEQIEHGAGLEDTRRTRALEAAGSGPAPTVKAPLKLAPAPGRLPLPGGLTLHLEPIEEGQRPQRPPLPTDLYPEVQTMPAPSIDHLRSAGDSSAARHNEIGVTAAEPDLPKLAELNRGFPELEEIRRHHRRVKQQLDEQWKRQLERHEAAVRGRHGLPGGGAPQVFEEYHVRRLPGGGRRVSYSKRTTHSTSYTSRGGQSSLQQSQRLQRRKRQHQPVRRRRQRPHQW